jgi:hypothetical protein
MGLVAHDKSIEHAPDMARTRETLPKELEKELLCRLLSVDVCIHFCRSDFAALPLNAGFRLRNGLIGMWEFAPSRDWLVRSPKSKTLAQEYSD